MYGKEIMRIFVFLLLSLVLSLPVSARLYRWVDDQGHVHYSDHLPTTAVKKAHEELDEHGMVVKKEGRAKTPEEIAREKELARLREAQRHQAEEQQAKDQLLLKTYRNEDEIILARDGKLATYDAQIRIAHTNIDRFKNRLETLKKRAAAIELKGRRVPVNLQRDLDNTRAQIKQSYASILRLEHDKDKIRKQYAADLDRFRELKALKKKAMPESEQAKRDRLAREAMVKTEIVCKPPVDCDQAWRRARAYAKAQATTSVYVDTARLFMTRPARGDNEISLSLSRLQPNPGEPEIIFLDVGCMNQTPGETLCRSPMAEVIRAGFRSAVLGAPQKTKRP